ncbi:hypothetical protein Nepgr_016410 [Nepenthes gracilis]|uniref:Uncharacterized protein n=1 Tax=Nepenthes gracilis TaxID=150966 RepID=A0AAD3SPN2_NEPGR|nr:hypothetical protein Nepgr_016410 [Nepenthes gracilis]
MFFVFVILDFLCIMAQWIVAFIDLVSCFCGPMVQLPRLDDLCVRSSTVDLSRIPDVMLLIICSILATYWNLQEWWMASCAFELALNYSSLAVAGGRARGIGAMVTSVQHSWDVLLLLKTFDGCWGYVAVVSLQMLASPRPGMNCSVGETVLVSSCCLHSVLGLFGCLAGAGIWTCLGGAARILSSGCCGLDSLGYNC